jgi:fumarate hydratase subunit beta
MAEYLLKTPLSEEEIRRLRIGDNIYISGILFTARDEAHRRAMEYVRDGRELPFELKDMAVYHCGPIIRRMNSGWEVVAAGPTTSMRMEPFEYEFIRETGVKVVVGKGGMGPSTSRALEDFGAVYGAYTGGAAVLAARAVKRVLDVDWLDLGMAEAVWVFEVSDFGPLIVAMDSRGGNLYEGVRRRAEKNRRRIYERIGL